MNYLVSLAGKFPEQTQAYWHLGLISRIFPTKLLGYCKGEGDGRCRTTTG